MDIDQEYEMMLMDAFAMDWKSKKNEPKTHCKHRNIKIWMRDVLVIYKTWVWNSKQRNTFGWYSFEISYWSTCLVIGWIRLKRF